MVRRSHRDGPGSANQAPRPRASGTNGPQTYPQTYTLLVWLSAGRWSPARRDHHCCAVTPALVRRTLSVEGESSSFNHYHSAPKRKDELMRCTCCLLYSRGDQRQLDAMIACQCPLARLVTLEVDRSLWRDPNFVGHPTWLGVTDLKGNSYCLMFFVETSISGLFDEQKVQKKSIYF